MISRLLRFGSTLLTAGAMVLGAAHVSAGTESVSWYPTDGGYVTNDTAAGSTVVFNQDNPGWVRNYYNGSDTTRLRCGYLTYDASDLETTGTMDNVVLSIMMFTKDVTNGSTIYVFGIDEDSDDIDYTALTYANAPGLDCGTEKVDVSGETQDQVVTLKSDGLYSTTAVATFTATAEGDTCLTAASTAFDDFVAADTDGIVTILLSPVDYGAAVTTDQVSAPYRGYDTGVDSGNAYFPTLTGDVKVDDVVVEPHETLDFEAHWPMDDGSGDDVEEIISGLDGTLYNSPSWVSASDCRTDGALTFDGTDDYMIANSSSAIDVAAGDFSVSFLVKHSASYGADEEPMLCWGTIAADTEAADGLDLGDGVRWCIYSKNGNVDFAIDDNVTKTSLSTDASSFYTGYWVHVVAVRDTSEGTLSIYAENVLVNSMDDEGTGSISQDNPLYIGRYNPTDTTTDGVDGATYFQGGIDDVRIYKTALNSADVAAINETYGSIAGNAAKNWVVFE